jgi:1-deoxy-D-xylulose-5-phosphate reductoisomerase
LDFFELDSKHFPAVELARHALRGGGVLGAALSAADEEAVELFLEGKIAFTDITRLVSAAVMSAQNAAPTLENIAAAAAQAREAVRSSLRG